MAETPRATDREGIRDLLETAAAIAESAGAIALRHFRKPLDVEDKSAGEDFDPVTVADREIESFIRKELVRRHPDHGILGEEEAALESDSAYRWVIDPIDGTRAFISGVPAWGILLGLTIDGACAAGVMHQPYLGETFLGSGSDAPDRGAWLRRSGSTTPIASRRNARLSDAILYSTHPSMFESGASRSAFERVANSCRMMRYGGDCYSYCLLALGQIDLVIEEGLQPYDIVPLIPIIVGSGGIVTNWQGGDASAGGRIIAAANETLHAQALDTLNSGPLSK